MFFHDTAGERKSQAGPAALGREERPKDVGKMLRRDTTPAVADNHSGAIAARPDLDVNGPRAFDSLNSVQKQVQKHLMNLIAVVLNFRQVGRLLQFDLDGF